MLSKNQVKFKETEIGMIPYDWDIKSLRDISTIIMGQSPPSSTYNTQNRGLPFFQGRRDFGRKYPSVMVWCSEPKRVAKQGDVLLSVRAPIGDVNIANEDSCIGRGLASLSINYKDNEFLYYLLVFNKEKIRAVFEGEGTVFGCVTKQGLNNFKVSIPSNSLERESIGNILSSLDEKIELNCQMDKTLEKIGQALFKRWFIDFEFPNEKGKPYKSSGGDMVDSDLGEIPKGWSIGNFEEIIEITSGKRPNDKSDIKTSEFNTPLIGASSVMGFVKEKLYDEPIIIIGRVGTHGIVQRIFYPSFPSDNTLVIKSKYYGYAYHILVTINYESLNVGTTQPLITQSSVRNLRIVIPDGKILDQYENLISNNFIKIYHNNAEIETLSSIRDSLLPKVMSGQIRVPAG